MSARREIFEAHYRRYQQAEKRDKGKILDEIAGTTGLNRDHGETSFRSPCAGELREEADNRD
ncbi:MAG: hypothetical protein LBT16_02495 [Treponema sp.]|jgi:hypothetical protein|nr:hypothetical protein [Treponema sp.]